MSKSELRRIEKVAPQAIAELREQIARQIEAEPCLWCTPVTHMYPCNSCKQKKLSAEIARGNK